MSWEESDDNSYRPIRDLPTGAILGSSSGSRIRQNSEFVVGSPRSGDIGCAVVFFCYDFGLPKNEM
jgi:hypothetical protein